MSLNPVQVIAFKTFKKFCIALTLFKKFCITLILLRIFPFDFPCENTCDNLGINSI